MSELTKNERESLAEFIEGYLIFCIQDDKAVDNLEWLCNICSAYRKLREVEE